MAVDYRLVLLARSFLMRVGDDSKEVKEDGGDFLSSEIDAMDYG